MIAIIRLDDLMYTGIGEDNAELGFKSLKVSFSSNITTTFLA